MEMRRLPAESVQCCVTSPPYWGLRDYKTPPGEWPAMSYLPMTGAGKITVPAWTGCFGQEPTVEMYVAHTVLIVREVRRVLKADGTVWWNLGDSYAGGGNGGGGSFANDGPRMLRMTGTNKNVPGRKGDRGVVGGLKAKDLGMIPARVALALQADGWYLRQDIIWAKRNCMPESVTDRCTRSHEHIFMLAKSPRYFYDAEAIKEPCIYDVDGTGTQARRARARESLKSHPNGERAGMRALPSGERLAAVTDAPLHGNGGFKDSRKMNGKHAGAKEFDGGAGARPMGDGLMLEAQRTSDGSESGAALRQRLPRSGAGSSGAIPAGKQRGHSRREAAGPFPPARGVQRPLGRDGEIRAVLGHAQQARCVDDCPGDLSGGALCHLPARPDQAVHPGGESRGRYGAGPVRRQRHDGSGGAGTGPQGHPHRVEPRVHPFDPETHPYHAGAGLGINLSTLN